MLSLTSHVDIHDGYAQNKQVVIPLLFVGHSVLTQCKLVMTADVGVVGENSQLVRVRRLLLAHVCGVL